MIDDSYPIPPREMVEEFKEALLEHKLSFSGVIEAKGLKVNLEIELALTEAFEEAVYETILRANPKDSWKLHCFHDRHKIPHILTIDSWTHYDILEDNVSVRFDVNPEFFYDSREEMMIEFESYEDLIAQMELFIKHCGK